jgi:hypothetical protein
MALKLITLPVDTPLFTLKATLTGTDYILRFDYQEKQDRWYVGLYDAQNNPIRVGMKAVCGWDILRTCSLSNRPPGQLFFLSGGKQAPPGFADLGRSTILIYVDAEPQAAT